MGPICMFDKSFLQGLSLDEAVLFDHFFLPVVVPLFYVETLADLAKVQKDRSPEQEVSRIAQKFPEVSGSPCAFHLDLVAADLVGNRVAMTGQIPRPGSRLVEDGKTTAAVWDSSPEQDAFDRWTNGEFLDLERTAAKHWRDALTNVDVTPMRRWLKAVGVDPSRCKDESQCLSLAQALTFDLSLKADPIELLLATMGADARLSAAVRRRYRHLGGPRLGAFAPYAAYVFRVEMFFQIAVAAGVIGTNPSNRLDIAYLFYLPFCMIFSSSDNLHRRCAPLFLRDDQSFVWGLDLKNDLRELNTYYSVFSEEDKAKGLMSLAPAPPATPPFLVSELYDRHLRKGWRDARSQDGTKEGAVSVARIMQIADAPVVDSSDVRVPDAVVIKRKVHKKRGSWYQLPADLFADTEDSTNDE